MHCSCCPWSVHVERQPGPTWAFLAWAGWIHLKATFLQDSVKVISTRLSDRSVFLLTGHLPASPPPLPPTLTHKFGRTLILHPPPTPHQHDPSAMSSQTQDTRQPLHHAILLQSGLRRILLACQEHSTAQCSSAVQRHHLCTLACQPATGGWLYKGISSISMVGTP